MKWLRSKVDVLTRSQWLCRSSAACSGPAAGQESSQLSVKHWTLAWTVWWCSVPLSPPMWCQWPTCDLTLWFTINSPWHTITHKTAAAVFTSCPNHLTKIVTFLLQMSEDTDDNWQWVRSNPNSTGRRMVAAFVRRNQAGMKTSSDNLYILK